MDEHRTLPTAVGRGVLQFEPLGHVEVQLDGRHLPASAQCVAHLDGDFRTVEGRPAGVGHQVQARGLRNLAQRLGGLFPHLVGADVLLRILGGQFQVEVVEAVVTEQFEDEVEQRGQLVAHLLTGGVDVRVVLGHPAHPGQAVDHPGLLVAVDGAEFEEPQWKFPVGTPPRAVDQVVHRAVHRFEVVVLPRFAQRAVLGVLGVDVHGREHAVGVPLEMSGSDVELFLGDVRGIDELVARLDVLTPGVLLQFPAHDAALGVEHRQAGPDLVGEAEQVQLHAEFAMVAALGFGQQLQMPVESLLGLPGGAVDALQAGVGLVAPPVRRGASGQRERRDVAGGGDVRAAAQIAPHPFPGAGIEVVVGGELVTPDLHDVRVTGLVVDEFEFVGLAGQFAAGLVLGLVHPAGEQLALLDDGPHPLLELLKVFRGEGGRHIEVVVEAVGDRRADAQLGVWEQLLHRLGQDVGRGVPDDAAAILSVGGHRGDLDVGVGGPAQIAQPALGVANHHDRVRFAAAGQSRVADRRAGGDPGGDLEDGRFGTCGGAHHGLFRPDDGRVPTGPEQHTTPRSVAPMLTADLIRSLLRPCPTGRVRADCPAPDGRGLSASPTRPAPRTATA